MYRNHKKFITLLERHFTFANKSLNEFVARQEIKCQA